jgi:hypothetical protein
MEFETRIQAYTAQSGINWSVSNVTKVHLALLSYMAFHTVRHNITYETNIARHRQQVEDMLSILFPKYKAKIGDHWDNHNCLYEFATGDAPPKGYHIPTVYIYPYGENQAKIKFYVVPVNGNFNTWQELEDACDNRVVFVDL